MKAIGNKSRFRISNLVVRIRIETSRIRNIGKGGDHEKKENKKKQDGGPPVRPRACPWECLSARYIAPPAWPGCSPKHKFRIIFSCKTDRLNTGTQNNRKLSSYFPQHLTYKQFERNFCQVC